MHNESTERLEHGWRVGAALADALELERRRLVELGALAGGRPRYLDDVATGLAGAGERAADGREPMPPGG